MFKRRVKVELVGGVGNQLFQYFAGRALAELHSVPLVLDVSLIGVNGTKHKSSIDVFDFPMDFVNHSGKGYFRRSFLGRLISWLFRKSCAFRSLSLHLFHRFESSVLGYDENLLQVRPPITISGYFQTRRYMDQVNALDSTKFSIKTSSPWFDEMENLLKLKTVVGLHVRRGDYVNLKDSFGLLSRNYYLDGLRSIEEQTQCEEIWVFSDDLESAALLLSDLDRIRYIDPPFESNPVESMLLLAKCKALIISNSTFAWWAGIINGGNMVFYPNPWFLASEYSKDLLLPEWQAIESSWENYTT